MEKITYLVANYNNGNYIDDCIASLHNQTSPHWQCIICDDKSKDDSLARIRPLLNEKVCLLTNEQNIGYTGTVTKLIAHAKTDIVGILDPDDALEPAATAAVLQAYQEHPQVGFVYTNFTFYNEALTYITAAGCSCAILPGYTSLETGFVSHLKTFRRHAYQQTAGYDERFLYAEDRDLIYKLEEVTPFYFLNVALYKYRHVAHSQSNHPEKNKIGTLNHRHAFEAALQRRGIHGLRKVLYQQYFHERYVQKRLPPTPLMIMGRTFWRLAVRALNKP